MRYNNDHRLIKKLILIASTVLSITAAAVVASSNLQRGRYISMRI